jgi:hypothetical protein
VTTSQQWRQYFAENARSLLEIPWERGPEMTPDEAAAISRSLAEFQAGENSEGKHLFRDAQRYAARTGDNEYVAAIRLFIAEEQRHARDLGRFLTLNGVPLVRTTFTDRVFRKLRHSFGGLEISIAVLITAEIIAKVYYKAVGSATQSVILRTLCDQILNDEIRHVEFQAEQLARLRAGRRRPGKVATMGVQRFLFWGTTLLVGHVHRRLLRWAGMSGREWRRECWREFNEAFAVSTTFRALQPATGSVASTSDLCAATRIVKTLDR